MALDEQQYLKIADFIFELAQLRRVKREGYRLVGVDSPESVADHSLRTSQLAFILAKLENAPRPQDSCVAALFHELGECRVGDLHTIAKTYVTSDEQAVVRDQTAPLGALGDKISQAWANAVTEQGVVKKIVKDADELEMAFTAREFAACGHKIAERFMNNAGERLATPFAKALFETLKQSDPQEWHRGLGDKK